jgi:hypothetical protein
MVVVAKDLTEVLDLVGEVHFLNEIYLIVILKCLFQVIRLGQVNISNTQKPAILEDAKVRFLTENQKRNVLG